MESKEGVIVGVILFAWVILLATVFVAVYTYITYVKVAAINELECDVPNTLEIETIRYVMLKKYYTIKMPIYRAHIELIRNSIFIIVAIAVTILLVACAIKKSENEGQKGGAVSYTAFMEDGLESFIKEYTMQFIALIILATGLIATIVLIPQINISAAQTHSNMTSANVAITILVPLFVIGVLVAAYYVQHFRVNLWKWLRKNPLAITIVSCVMILTLVLTLNIDALFKQSMIDSYTAGYNTMLAPVMPGTDPMNTIWSRLSRARGSLMDRIYTRYAAYNNVTYETAKNNIDDTNNPTLKVYYMMFAKQSPDLAELLSPVSMLEGYTNLEQFPLDQQSQVVANFIKVNCAKAGVIPFVQGTLTPDQVKSIVEQFNSYAPLLTFQTASSSVQTFFQTYYEWMREQSGSPLLMIEQAFDYTSLDPVTSNTYNTLFTHFISTEASYIPCDIASPLFVKSQIDALFAAKNYTELSQYFIFNVYLPLQNLNTIAGMTDNVYKTFNDMCTNMFVVLWICIALSLAPLYAMVIITWKTMGRIGIIIAAFIVLILTLGIYAIAGRPVQNHSIGTG